MRVIDEAQVASVLTLAELTDALQAALEQLGRAEAATTVRVRAASNGAMASALAAVWPSGGVAGGKVYATHAGSFTFLVAMFDLQGRALAVLEGDQLTRMRTAAGTAVAIRHLASGPVRIATVVGVGRQGPGHLDVLAQECPDIAEVRIVGRRAASVEGMLAHGRALGLPVRTLTDADEAVADAELVITLTSAAAPVFSGAALREDALVCAIGATKADRREVDGVTVQRAAAVVVDSLEGAPQECGDLIQAVEEGVFEWEQMLDLATVLADPSGLPPGGLRLFESQGIALQDVVAGAVVLRHLV